MHGRRREEGGGGGRRRREGGKRERGKKEEKDMIYSDPVETRIMTYPYTSCSSSRRFRLFKMTPQSRWSLQGRSGASSLETRH